MGWCVEGGCWKSYLCLLNFRIELQIKLIYVLFLKQLLMMENDFVKIENESPIESTDQQLRENMMVHFYNDDSEAEENFRFDAVKMENQLESAEEIMEELENYLPIRTTNINEILEFARTSAMFNIADWDGLRSSIVKRKKTLKRLYAKGRVKKPLVKQEFVLPVELKDNAQIQQEDQVEIKKKRNRMSAQISRDRKKEHVKQLEVNFENLRKQNERTRAENERLKEQLKMFNETERKPGPQFIPKQKNKLMSFLMLLGVLFLISLVKDLFKPYQSNSQFFNLSSLQSKDNILTVDEQSELVGRSKQLLAGIDLDDNENSNAGMKNAVLLKLNQFEQQQQPTVFPKGLLQKVIKINHDII